MIPMTAFTSPEFEALAQLAGVDVERARSAFKEPLRLLELLTLAELQGLQRASERFGEVNREMARAIGEWTAFAKGFIAARAANGNESSGD